MFEECCVRSGCVPDSPDVLKPCGTIRNKAPDHIQWKAKYLANVNYLRILARPKWALRTLGCRERSMAALRRSQYPFGGLIGWQVRLPVFKSGLTCKRIRTTPFHQAFSLWGICEILSLIGNSAISNGLLPSDLKNNIFQGLAKFQHIQRPETSGKSSWVILL